MHSDQIGISQVGKIWNFSVLKLLPVLPLRRIPCIGMIKVLIDAIVLCKRKRDYFFSTLLEYIQMAGEGGAITVILHGNQGK
jgi:hypothetical protein